MAKFFIIKLVPFFLLFSLIFVSFFYPSSVRAAGELSGYLQGGGTEDDYIYTVTKDSASDLIFGGSYQSLKIGYSAYNLSADNTVVDLDPTSGTDYRTANGVKDAFVTKMNSDGTYGWSATIGGTGADAVLNVAADSTGAILATGFFRGTNVDLDPGVGTSFVSSLGATDNSAFLTKYTSSGALSWYKVMDGGTTGTYDSGNAVAVDSSNNVLWAYVTGSTSANSKVIVNKYDSSGNQLWTTSVNIGITYTPLTSIPIVSIGLDVSDNVIVTGSFGGTQDMDGTAGAANFTSKGSADAFVTKYSPSGSYLWTKTFGSFYNIIPTKLRINRSTGEIYISGNFNGTGSDFDPGAGTYSLNPKNSFPKMDPFIEKLDNNGLFLWARNFGPSVSSLNSFDLDSSGNPILVGNYVPGPNIAVNFNGSGGTDSHPAMGPITYDGNNIFITKYNADGSYGWAIDMGSYRDESANDVVIIGSTLNLGGNFRGKFDIDPSSSVTSLTSNGESVDYFLSKYNLTNINGSLFGTNPLQIISSPLPSFPTTANATFGVSTSVYTTVVDYVHKRLYVGGRFTTLAGSARTALAAIDLTTNKLTSWSPSISGLGPWVNALQLSADSSTLYVGGYFNSVNGVGTSNLVSFDTATGNLNAWYPNPDDQIETMALNDAAGSLYIGGDFWHVGATAIRYLAEVKTATALPTAWNPTPSSYLRSMTFNNDKTALYVGGNFTTMGGLTRSYLAEVLLSDGSSPAIGSGNGVGFDGIVSTLNIFNNKLYAGGYFTKSGTIPRPAAASIDLTDNTLTSWRPWIGPNNNYVQNIYVDNNAVYLAGGFTQAGPERMYVNNLAVVDSTTGGLLDQYYQGANSGQTLSLTVRASGSSKTMYLAGNLGIAQLGPNFPGPPIITLASPSNTFSSSFKVIAKVTDEQGVKITEISADNGNTWSACSPDDGLWGGTSENISCQLTGLTPGSYNYLLRATDNDTPQYTTAVADYVPYALTVVPPPLDSLFAYWTLDSTSTLTDTLGFVPAGIAYTNPFIAALGHLNFAYNFNSPTNSFRIEDKNKVLTFGNLADSSFTLDTWVNKTNFVSGTNAVIIGRMNDADTANTWALGVDALGGAYCTVTDGSGVEHTVSSGADGFLFTNNVWNEAGCSWNPNTGNLRVYINNINVKSLAVDVGSRTLQDSTNRLVMAARSDLSYKYIGLIDEVKIYGDAIDLSTGLPETDAAPTPINTPTPTTSPSPSSSPTPTLTPTPVITDGAPTPAPPASSSQGSVLGDYIVANANIVPQYPPDLFQIDTTVSSATLHFSPAAGPNSYYEIFYGTNKKADQFNVKFDQGPSSGALTFTINALNPGTTYFFKIHGGNLNTSGPWSQTVSAKTQPSSQSTSSVPKFNPTLTPTPTSVNAWLSSAAPVSAASSSPLVIDQKPFAYYTLSSKPSLPAVNGDINALVTDASGNTYIAGTFTAAGSVTTSIAKIDPSGHVDKKFIYNVSGTVNSLSLDSTNNLLYVGGSFTRINNVSYSNLAAINLQANQLQPLSYGFGNTVISTAISTNGSQLYVAASTPKNSSASNNKTPSSTPASSNSSTPTPTSPGNKKKLSSTPTATPTPLSDLSTLSLTDTPAATLTPTLTAAPTLTPTSTPTLTPTLTAAPTSTPTSIPSATAYISPVETLAVTPTVELIPTLTIAPLNAGTTALGGSDIAIIDSPQTPDTGTTNPTGEVWTIDTKTTDAHVDTVANGPINSIALADNNTLIVGGNFGVVGGVSRPNLAAVDLASNRPTSWNPKPDAPVRSVVINNNIAGVVFAAGDFNYIGSQKHSKYAAIDLKTARATSWTPVCTWWLFILIGQALLTLIYYRLIPRIKFKLWWFLPALLVITSSAFDQYAHNYYVPSSVCNYLLLISLTVTVFTSWVYFQGIAKTKTR